MIKFLLLCNFLLLSGILFCQKQIDFSFPASKDWDFRKNFFDYSSEKHSLLGYRCEDDENMYRLIVDTAGNVLHKSVEKRWWSNYAPNKEELAKYLKKPNYCFSNAFYQLPTVLSDTEESTICVHKNTKQIVESNLIFGATSTQTVIGSLEQNEEVVHFLGNDNVSGVVCITPALDRLVLYLFRFERGLEKLSYRIKDEGVFNGHKEKGFSGYQHSQFSGFSEEANYFFPRASFNFSNASDTINFLFATDTHYYQLKIDTKNGGIRESQVDYVLINQIPIADRFKVGHTLGNSSLLMTFFSKNKLEFIDYDNHRDVIRNSFSIANNTADTVIDVSSVSLGAFGLKEKKEKNAGRLFDNYSIKNAFPYQIRKGDTAVFMLNTLMQVADKPFNKIMRILPIGSFLGALSFIALASTMTASPFLNGLMSGQEVQFFYIRSINGKLEAVDRLWAEANNPLHKISEKYKDADNNLFSLVILKDKFYILTQKDKKSQLMLELVGY